jgi:c-di-GMP-binding flagellar brake protein YcgR
MSRERRKFVRVALEMASSCSFLDASGLPKNVSQVTILDLSAGGAKIQTREPLVPGAPVRLHVHGEDPAIDVNVLARALRVDRQADGSVAAGLEFVALQPPDRVQLTRFVLTAARKSGQGGERVMGGPTAA